MGKLKTLSTAVFIGAGAYAARRWAQDKPSREDRERISYPPTDTPKSIDEAIWIVDGNPVRPMGLSIPIRMTVIRLTNGDLLLHSPIQMTESLAQQIEELGPIRHLVAPGIAHWTFLTDWQKAYPKALTWAVPHLRDRPQVRKSGVRIDRELSDAAPEEWSQDIELGLVRGGGGFCEAYLLHRASRTLVLTDLVQNLEQDKLPPVTAAAAKLTRATRGETAAHVRAAILLGGNEAKESIRQMIALQPDRVIFAHGAWFAEEGAALLRHAFNWLI